MDKEKYDDYKNYINQLENEYRTTFEKIEAYINGSSKLNSLEKNNCFLQILDMFLSSQEEGNPVKEITGVDLKKYCDDMIYGETIYIYKASRIFSLLLGAFIYILYMQISTRVPHAIYLKDSSLIFLPINFGIGDIVLMLGYICIPKLINQITRSYFENPIHCKKVKRYTYYVVWVLTLVIYSFTKDFFVNYIVSISFVNTVLILIYLTLIALAVYFLTKNFDEENLEDKRLEKENKYLELLNKQYNIYVEKCQINGRNPLDWIKFIKKKSENNSILIKVFFIYSIICLALAIILGTGMLVKGNGNIDIVGLIFLICIFSLDVVIVAAINYGIQRNKQLAKI